MPVTFENKPQARSAEAITRLDATFQARDGTVLHGYQWSSRHAEQQGGAIVVLMHGYGEHCERYRELASLLVTQGHPVAGFDARGHGRSPGQRGHIDDYDRYVADLQQFMLEIRPRHRGRPLVLLGHSNGGLIALRTVQTRRPLPDGLILVSPLIALQPAHRPLPLWAAEIVASFAGRLPLPSGLAASELSHDPVVIEASRNDPFSHTLTTPRWYVCARRAMEQAIAQLDAVTLPVLIVHGDGDSIADPRAIERMAALIPSSDKEQLSCRGAFHEVLNETGRADTQQRIARWISQRFGARAAA
jgi:alpha-beta hydrolase superfamily lysophospholipase